MLNRLIAFTARLGFILACGCFACGIVMIGMRYPLVAVVLAGLVAWRRLGRHHGSSWTHGSATIASSMQIERAGLMADEGLMLGRCLPDKPSKSAALSALLNPMIGHETACRTFLAAFFSKQWLADRMLRLTSYIHLATYAPAGAGKGIAVLIPNLLSYRGSCVVTDPKGELFKATAKHRRKKFGSKIFRLDPFEICGPGSDTLNPLDFIDPKADDFLDQCRDLASMLIVRSGEQKDPFWDDSAELNVTGFTAFTCGFEPKKELRTLDTVRGIASSRHGYAKAIEIMQQVGECQGVIRRLGGLLTWFTGEALSGVLSTFQRHTAFLDSPVVKRNTAASSFDPMILRRKKATIYLILPADRLISLAALQRMWVGTIMQRITAGVPTEKNPVLWLLDEYAHIGHMRAIEDAVTLKRGMGMRLWFFFQSVEQLKTCFGEHASTIADNIGTSQFFGINSYETAESISKRVGETTIRTVSKNRTVSSSSPTGGGPQGPGSGSRSTSDSTTTSDIARRLLKPEEILTLPDDVTLIFHKNLPVITAQLVKYFKAPEFRWGRSGKQRRLGLAAGIMAAFAVVAGLMLVSFASSLPYQQRTNRPGPASYLPEQVKDGWNRVVGGNATTLPVPGFRNWNRPGKGF